jgi:RHS repeat-associated protein
MGIIAAAWPRLGAAQLAPTGGHYAGRASDTGTEPGVVNASGGYTVSVPLDLPATRGGMPVPLSITSGARGVGAAGRGWDVPLSYIRRDRTYAHRKPRIGSDVAPEGREQVTLSLQGQAMDLLPKGDTWIARYDAPDLSLREQNGTWVMYDGRGMTWTFVEPPALAGAGLWLLSSIHGSGNNAVQLEYDISPVALPGGSGVTVDLRRVRYNKHPQSDCYKHEITLNYGATATAPLSLSMLGDRVLARLRTLSTVDVGSRASCAGSTERLRTYSLTYLPDADTQQPRLSAVHLFGRQGTPEQSVPLPVASFGYGSATSSGRLTYQKTQSIPLPAGPDVTRISATARDGTFTPPIYLGTGSATWQSLTDITGDGLPDLVYPQSGKLWVALNRPGGAGTTTLGAGTALGQLSDTTFVSGPFETRSATQNRFPNNSAALNIDVVWRQALDVNGDGRVDIVDAAEAPGQWVIYLNTPGTGASGVKWERRSYDISRLYFHLQRRGHSLSNDYLPLSRRFSGHDRIVGACWRYDGTEWVSYPEGFTNGSCSAFPNRELSAGEEKTYTEWEIRDVNGDGFPDLVFNSSRVDVVPLGGPFLPGFPGEVANTQLRLEVQPLQGDGNKVDAVLNLYGLFIEQNSPVFSAPITLKEGTSCGVGLWATSLDRQRVICGLADVNGDGLLDRIEDRLTVYLGTGRGFSSVTLTLPETFSTQVNQQFLVCATPSPPPPGSTPFFALQSTGLRDLTGDGIPDFLSRGTDSTWSVSIGTGAGFAPPVAVEVVGTGFDISRVQERCDGTTSLTTGGLYDINGDGKPEVVRLNGTGLDVYQLSGGSLPGKPEAGRIVQVDNGHGARTTVGYRSAKEDGTTRHQVPFPEIVVTSVETVGAQGLGGSLQAMRYAYGGAELMYDSALQTFTMPGYQRSVAVRPLPGGNRVMGHATLTDTYPLPPVTTTSKSERFGRYLLAGKVRDITVLSGVSGDPWALLSLDVTTTTRRIGGTRYEWATKFFEEPPVPGSSNAGLDCFEMAYPLDFLNSWVTNFNAYNPCTAHGFAYARTTDSWRGQAAPPSTSNVATRSEVQGVDDFGRVLNVLHHNDVYRGDDDICVETQYAVPVGANERILYAPSSRRYWDCTRPGLPTYASESWRYDNLTQGYVSAGDLTSHSRDRRDASTGALLNTVLMYTASYDAAGNPSTVTRVREDGAVRTVSLVYDAFGLTLVGQRVDATGVPVLISSATLDEVSLDALSTLDPNQTRYGTAFDGYGRPVRATVTPPGGSLGVLATTSYQGFSGGDPLGRRIVSKSFSNPVPPGTEGSAPGLTRTVYLDELGRSRRTELALGPDYGNEVMIAGARTYDGFGRVVFEADPYPASQNGATAYGTTHFFNADGTPWCSIRGHGPQPFSNITDEAAERYPTCYSRSFSANQETWTLSDASSLLSSSPQAGVTRSATLTAAGRLLSRSTWQGTSRLEHATFTHDRLGQLTSMMRYQDPAGLTGLVHWSWTYDSFGQRIQWQQPESPVQTARFSDWGEPLEVSWTDFVSSPTGTRSLLSRYDALGRVTRQEERINGAVDFETVNEFFYDVGVSPTGIVSPTNVLGRLARAKAPVGDVFYSYDAFGRQDARTFTDTLGGTYVERTRRNGDGSLAALEFYLPDANYKKEWAEYTYDSARRLKGIQFTTTDGTRQLFQAEVIDPFGRVRKARHGGVATFEASYADVGRRLLNETAVSSVYGSRRFINLGYDPLGREKARREIKDGATTGPKTNTGYDALGRLMSSLTTDGSLTLSNWQYTYDALGNLLRHNNLLSSSQNATLSYRTGDRDRLCRVSYFNTTGTTCNVVHDALGNVLEMPTRMGSTRRLGYFPSGDVRSISDGAVLATFRYGALGTVRELHLQGSALDSRREWQFGGFIERKESAINGVPMAIISRNIPGPGGLVASRRGHTDNWIFHFGEPRGARFTTDVRGAFVQDIDYQPYGRPTSTGSEYPGTLLYSGIQWNGGDTLAALGLSHLGARIYDPLVGRFLSRDPLFVPRTTATTHPYAFAMNDPLNLTDPTGLDPGCIGVECSGGGGGGFPGGGGGPREINPPGLYFPASAPATGGANPQAAYRPPPTATFSLGPTGPQTIQGRALQVSVRVLSGIDMPDGFNWDTLAATGISVGDALDTIANTQEGAEAAVAEYNATLDRWSSYSAALGDSIIFWCPGCTQNMRRTWLGPNNSGDADAQAYALASVVGFLGSVMMPMPKMSIKPPKGNVMAELRVTAQEVRISACSNGQNCAYVAHSFDSALKGKSPLAHGSMPMDATDFERLNMTTFVPHGSAKDVVISVRMWGDGSQGIVLGIHPYTAGVGARPGHVLNVVNRGGTIYFIDATHEAGRASLKPFVEFGLMRTR